MQQIEKVLVMPTVTNKTHAPTCRTTDFTRPRMVGLPVDLNSAPVIAAAARLLVSEVITRLDQRHYVNTSPTKNQECQRYTYLTEFSGGTLCTRNCVWRHSECTHLQQEKIFACIEAYITLNTLLFAGF